MAVYTPLNLEEAQAFLSAYDLGELRECRGIAEGIENSNFLLMTERGKFILTLFEKRVDAADLPYFMALMQWLAERGIACPQPIRNRTGEVIGELKEKKAAIVSFKEGKGISLIEAAHLPPLGELCAHMHLASQGFTPCRKNALSLPGWQALAKQIGRCAEEVSPGLSALIAEELSHLETHWPRILPGGAVHADLFPDNVFFEGENISGVIDFYFACDDFFAYDLAICLNAWCFDAAQHFQPEHARALIAAYQKIRPLEAEEKAHFLTLARGAALRFLLTRTYDWLNTPAGALVTRKDPAEYVKKLKFLQNANASELGL